MEYNEVIQYMNKRWKSDMKLGLSRVKALLAELGHPEKQLRFIHVAGTNGKGSTVTAIASILAAADYKVGVYTSPYLERFTDRIRILNGKSSLAQRLQDSSAGEIAQDTVAALFTEILAACDRIRARAVRRLPSSRFSLQQPYCIFIASLVRWWCWKQGWEADLTQPMLLTSLR